MDAQTPPYTFLLNKTIYSLPHVLFYVVFSLQVANLFRVCGVESVRQLLRSVLGSALQLTVLSTRWTVA